MSCTWCPAAANFKSSRGPSEANVIKPSQANFSNPFRNHQASKFFLTSTTSAFLCLWFFSPRILLVTPWTILSSILEYLLLLLILFEAANLIVEKQRIRVTQPVFSRVVDTFPPSGKTEDASQSRSPRPSTVADLQNSNWTATMSKNSDLLQSLPLPTIERPFGIQLWPIFDQAFTALMGYHPQDFDFQPRVTPMSTLKQSTIMIAVYYIVILGGREIMRNRPALKLNGLFMCHNFGLTAISGILLALFLEQLIPTVYNHGIFYAICDVKGGWTPPLVILYYVCIYCQPETTVTDRD